MSQPLDNSPNNPYDSDMMERLAEKICDSEHVMFITGAGISVSSGLPTYRGVGGLYRGESMIPPEVLMSGWMLKHFPGKVWEHLHAIYKASAGAKPNAGHKAISGLEAFTKVTVVTQNVDGLHLMAGSTNVVELHGNAQSLECTECDYYFKNPAFEEMSGVPRCPDCNSVLRPPVVLFGEQIRGADKLYAAFEGRMPDVVIAVGTTARFPYILEPLEIAQLNGRTTAVIDPEPCDELRQLSEYVIIDNADSLKQLIKMVADRKATFEKPALATP
jgi:NAD-dependent deacetylase